MLCTSVVSEVIVLFFSVCMKKLTGSWSNSHDRLALPNLQKLVNYDEREEKKKPQSNDSYRAIFCTSETSSVICGSPVMLDVC